MDNVTITLKRFVKKLDKAPRPLKCQLVLIYVCMFEFIGLFYFQPNHSLTSHKQHGPHNGRKATPIA